MKKFVYFLIFVLLLSSVSATLIRHYNFDSQDCTDSGNDATDCTTTGTMGWETGYGGEGYALNLYDNTDYINLPTSAAYQLDGTEPFCISFLYKKLSNPANTQYLILHQSGAGGEFRIYAQQYLDGRINFNAQESGSGGGDATTTEYLGNNGWTLITMTMNSSGKMTQFWNNTVKATATYSYALANEVTSSVIYFTHDGINQDYNKTFDDLKIWDVECTDTMIQDNYNDVFNIASPILGLYTSLINNTENYNSQILNFTYNGTCSDCETDLVNISFFHNGILNQTLQNINISNNQVYNITLPNDYTDYYNVSFNVSNAEVFNESGVYIYNVDLKAPIINSDFVNNTDFDQNNTLSFNINFTDPNLFAYNITFFYLNGTVYDNHNYFATNLTTTFEENSTVFNLTTIGNFFIIAESWDSHTNNIVRDYSVISTPKKLEFDRKIKIESNNLIDTDYTKKLDRYEFDFNFEKTKGNIVYVESTDYLYYLPESRYKAHFVDLTNNYWVDFESDNLQNIQIERINNKKFKVTLDTKTTQITFKSIGDLNYNSKTWYYSVEEVIPNVTSNETNQTITPLTTSQSIEILSNSVNFIGYLVIFIFAWLIYFTQLFTNVDQILNYISILLFLACIFLFANNYEILVYISIGGFIFNTFSLYGTEDES